MPIKPYIGIVTTNITPPFQNDIPFEYRRLLENVQLYVDYTEHYFPRIVHEDFSTTLSSANQQYRIYLIKSDEEYQIHEWCVDNCTSYWSSVFLDDSQLFVFENDNDALAFKLTFPDIICVQALPESPPIARASVLQKSTFARFLESWVLVGNQGRFTYKTNIGDFDNYLQYDISIYDFGFAQKFIPILRNIASNTYI